MRRLGVLVILLATIGNSAPCQKAFRTRVADSVVSGRRHITVSASNDSSIAVIAQNADPKSQMRYGVAIVPVEEVVPFIATTDSILRIAVMRQRGEQVTYRAATLGLSITRSVSDVSDRYFLNASSGTGVAELDLSPTEVRRVLEALRRASEMSVSMTPAHGEEQFHQGQAGYPPTLTEGILPPPAPKNADGVTLFADFFVNSKGGSVLRRVSKTGDESFDRKFKDMLNQARFRPGTRADGTPIDTTVTLTFYLRRP